MKISIKCKNGNTVERFYDRSSRSSVTICHDSKGMQVGTAEYDGNKVSAKASLEMMIRDNGGSI